MYPFNKPLLEVTEQDVAALTEDENIRLDYKGDLSKSGGSKGEWKDELRKDVTAFANTAGGTLIIGVHEKNKSPTAFPGVKFFAGKTADKIEQEVGNALTARVEPRIPGLRIRAIPVSDTDHHFVVIQVPGRSWAAPHWVELEEIAGQARGISMWHRIGTTNRVMGYGEAERAFRDRFLGQRALEGFRQERVADLAGGTSVLGNLPPAYVLHIVPYSAAENSNSPDLSELGEYPQEFSRFATHWFQLTHGSYQDEFYDYYGFGCLYRDHFRANETTHGLARIYRNGAVELVEARQMRGFKAFNTSTVLSNLEASMEFQLKLLESLDVPGPYEVFLSLVHVQGLEAERNVFSQDTYLFPGIRVNSRGTVREDLSALRVHISNTAGYAKTREFGARPTYQTLETPWRPALQAELVSQNDGAANS